MSTIRIARRKKYAQIERSTIEDRRLSFRARGVLAWLLAKPDDWTCDGRAVANATEQEGRDAVYTALKELETFGYLERNRWQDPATKQWRTESMVHECPIAPVTEKPDPASQDPATPESADQESSTNHEDQRRRETPKPPSSSEEEAPFDPLAKPELTELEKRRNREHARQIREARAAGRSLTDVESGAL